MFKYPTLLLSAIAWSLSLALIAAAQESRVQTVLRAFDAAKPNARSLTFYSLDWAANLPEAKERARKEGRPIFLILNTNITAGTNFFAGHT